MLGLHVFYFPSISRNPRVKIHYAIVKLSPPQISLFVTKSGIHLTKFRQRAILEIRRKQVLRNSPRIPHFISIAQTTFNLQSNTPHLSSIHLSTPSDEHFVSLSIHPPTFLHSKFLPRIRDIAARPSNPHYYLPAIHTMHTHS